MEAEDWLRRTDFAVTFQDRYGAEIGRRGIKHDESVPFDELPEPFIKAVLATEDRRFFHHFGIDVIGTLRALTVNAHAGGVVPYFAWRLSVSPMIDARLPQVSPEQIFARLGQFWYDTALCPTPQTMACLAGVARPEQIVFGTDWPFANVNVTETAMKTYESLPAISSAERAAIDRGNALRLFPRFAA